MANMFKPYWAAIVAKLKADVDLIAICSDISEEPGDGWPKIWVEDGGAEDWSTKTEIGIHPTLTLHIGSRYNGGKQLRELVDLVHKCLHDADLVLTEGNSVLCLYKSSTSFQDNDEAGKTRHTVMQFDLLITEG